MVQDGATPGEARGHISLFDIHGLIEPSRTDLLDFQRPYAHAGPPSHDFVEVIRRVKPTAIIGVSTQGRAFTREVIEAMASRNERPIIFALSNPTDRAECTAAEAYRWSGGRALYAAGVPFPPVRIDGKTLVPGQGNNLYVFPALGLAIVATRAGRITDEMLLVAARAIADQVTQAELDEGLLYPPQSDILNTEIATAVRIADVVFARGLAGVPRPKDTRAFLESQLYQPSYPDLVAAKARA
jgi:malate dehydrogenase (oxaloacetate-decarboxylating)(NADP+)